MLAETVADTDGQTLGILKYKITLVRVAGVIHFTNRMFFLMPEQPSQSRGCYHISHTNHTTNTR